MLYLRRFGRRVKGWFLSLVVVVQGWFKSLRFAARMRNYGLDAHYIREAFNYLAELDLDELREVKGYKGAGRLLLYGCGNMVKIRQEILSAPADVPEAERTWNRLYELTIQDNWNGQIYAHEWRSTTRKVKLEYGSEVESHWWEIYRSGRTVEAQATGKMIYYLRMLYGDKPELET